MPTTATKDKPAEPLADPAPDKPAEPADAAPRAEARRAEPDRLADSLHGKIAEVQAKLGVMPKDRTVTVKKGSETLYSYEYLSESALMSAIRPELARRGVAIYVSTNAQRREGSLTLVEVSMTFADAGTGETFTVRGQGQGADTGDKGVYKAITGAVRYMLWKTFLIPTEGDDPNQPHDVDAARPELPVSVGEAIPPIELWVEDAKPWIREATEKFYAEVETFPAKVSDLPDRVRADLIRRLQRVVIDLGAESKINPVQDPEKAQVFVRGVFAKAFEGTEVLGPDPFAPTIPF